MCSVITQTLDVSRWNMHKTLHVQRLIRYNHNDVIKWKHFPRHWSFVRGIHRSPVNSPHKGQWRGALMLSLICAWINGWVNNGEAGDLKRHRVHYDVTVMTQERYPITRTQLWGSFCVVYIYHISSINCRIMFRISLKMLPLTKGHHWFRWHVANKTDD